MKKSKGKDLNKLALQIVYWCAIVAVIIFGVSVILVGAFRAYQIGYNIFYDVPYEENNTTKIVVTVPEGCNMGVMASALEKEGVIGDGMVFYLQSFLYGYKLSTGKHTISPSMTGVEILQVLSETEEAIE